jgi:hypothetical protein
MRIVFVLMGVAVSFVQEQPFERGDPHDFSRTAWTHKHSPLAP